MLLPGTGTHLETPPRLLVWAPAWRHVTVQRVTTPPQTDSCDVSASAGLPCSMAIYGSVWSNLIQSPCEVCDHVQMTVTISTCNGPTQCPVPALTQPAVSPFPGPGQKRLSRAVVPSLFLARPHLRVSGILMTPPHTHIHTHRTPIIQKVTPIHVEEA